MATATPGAIPQQTARSHAKLRLRILRQLESLEFQISSLDLSIKELGDSID